MISYPNKPTPFGCRMKIKRQKKACRIIRTYEANFGFKSPFQVLIDGTFCNACLHAKVNIAEQLQTYLIGSRVSSTSSTQDIRRSSAFSALSSVKLLTTICCVNEVQQLGRPLTGALTILKQFAIHKCGHEGDQLRPAAKCLKSMVTASTSASDMQQHYFVATQDEELRQRLRKVPGVPIIYLHNCAPTLEKASVATTDHIARNLQQQLQRNNVMTENVSILRKRKRKVGNPNPLSCLPKKSKAAKQVAKAAKIKNGQTTSIQCNACDVSEK